MKKELRPVHDVVTCDVCGRTILKGERTEPYLAPSGHRHQVCDLCFGRAEHHGWIRESLAETMPTRVPRAEPRRGVLGRLRRRRPPEPPRQYGREPEEAAVAEEEQQEATSGAGNGAEPGEPAEPEAEPAAPPPRERPRSRPKDPRHVRAVPTTPEGKVERAVDLFNGSDHQRTIAGLARTLGQPWVAVRPDPGAASEVSLVVAWELSWYRFRIDLGDEGDPVAMLDKGDELHELDEQERSWNAALDGEGRVMADGAGSDAGPEGG
ncbi:MAG TPA: hypothetical protein VI122_13140 [Thermoleophilaceae bacterium]